MNRFLSALVGCLGLMSVAVPPTWAQNAFPSAPVTLMVPFQPGGPTDLIGRLLAEGLAKKWGQQVIVLNKPGAGAQTGTEFVARAAPDGYTIGMAISAHYINPAVRSNLPYDTLKDLTGVSIFGVTQVLMISRPDFPANDLAGVLAEAKKRPGGLTYAVAGGLGSSTHLAGELLAQMAGIKLSAVSYPGSPAALTDLQNGLVDIMFDPWSSVSGQFDGKRVKVIANASSQAVNGHPEFDSIPKAFPGYDAPSIQGIIAPGKTPKAILDRLTADIREVVLNEPVAGRLKEYGMIPVGSSAEEYNSVIEREIKKWTETAQKAGIRLD
jgi:tripartite-type tricarboxylate transporter receptor subunit TctC